MKKIFFHFIIFFCFSVSNAQFYGGYGDGYSSALSDGIPLPVEITEFTAFHSIDNKIELYWQTATEVNNYGFEVERQYQLSNIEYQDYNWETIGFVQGSGTTSSPTEYSFTDDLNPNLNPNLNLNLTQVSYRLKQIDNDGSFAYSKVVTVDFTSITSVEEDIQYQFAVEQNFPNPFNPSTAIKYSIPNSGNVKLIVYDVLGKEVKTLVNDFQNAGKYSSEFNAEGFSSGVYFYRLSAGRFSETRKLLLLR